MASMDRTDAQTNTSADKSAVSKFFSDAYNDGLVKTITEHPKEAAIAAGAAVVAVGAVAAAAYLTKGRSLAEESSMIMRPATEALTTRGISITPATRAAALDLIKEQPFARDQALRQISSTDMLLGRHVVGQTGESFMTKPATNALTESGIPITAANRSAVKEALQLPPWERNAAVKALAERIESTTAIDQAALRQSMEGPRAPFVAPDRVDAIIKDVLPKGQPVGSGLPHHWIDNGWPVKFTEYDRTNVAKVVSDRRFGGYPAGTGKGF